MIDPTEADIGRRVRWLSRRRNVGTLTGFNDTWAFVKFIYSEEAVPAAREDLNWADDNLGVVQTSEVAAEAREA